MTRKVFAQILLRENLDIYKTLAWFYSIYLFGSNIHIPFGSEFTAKICLTSLTEVGLDCRIEHTKELNEVVIKYYNE